MDGDSGSDHQWAVAATSTVFRFSPHSHRAAQINWRPWGSEAFQEAEQLDRPIFLLITSTWSQWCHIMDETTLSEPGIINILNRDYIPIRVDSDLRPDVNQRYNQNGWPSVVLLTPEGEILWGGIYVPLSQMLYNLGYIRRYYSEHHQEIREQARAVQERRFGQQPTRTSPRHGLRTLLEEERTALTALPADAGRVLRDLYDEDYGGFKIHPHLKFPHPESLELLMMLSQHEHQPDALAMVCYSLEQMRDGGLWDEEEGGFFHYAAASDWSMPHTEKMLEENAAMLRLLLLTAQATCDQQWPDLARRLIQYVNATLLQPIPGVFSGSQSADEEYYLPGSSSRSLLQPPPVDTTIYTAANARMISSYLLAAQILRQPSLEAIALRALDWLCKHMVHPKGCMYHYHLDGCPGLPGQLADLVWMTRALLDACDLHARKTYLETAIALMHFACEELLDEDCGLFDDYPPQQLAQGRLVLREQPLVENAVAAENLLRMAAYSHRHSLSDTGLFVLSGCLEKYRGAGIQGAAYACVVEQAMINTWL
jgi:uncharacterized protein YyaL (SSP411 family)